MARIGANGRVSWRAEGSLLDLTRRRAAVDPVDIEAGEQVLRVDRRRAALVIIDLQNDFCAPGGWLSHIGVDISPTRRAVERVGALLPVIRDASIPVIWLNWGNRPDRANLPPSVLHVYDPDGEGVGIGDPLPHNGSRVLERGSWSAAVVEDLEVASGDIVVDKFRMSGFVDTELDSVLRNLDVSTLFFAGVNVDQCVLATLTEAAALGYDCILLSDCCATTSGAAREESTLYNVAQCFGLVATGAALGAALTERVPAERIEVSRIDAYRITAGDSVKLVPVREPDSRLGSSTFFEIWDPGGSQPPNSHPNSVETFLFLRGTGIARCDGAEQEVAAGDYLVLPAGSVHQIANTGAGRLYAVTTMVNDGGFHALVRRGLPEPLDESDLAVLRGTIG